MCAIQLASAIDMEIVDIKLTTINQSVNGTAQMPTEKCMENCKFVHKSKHSFAKLMAHLILYLKTCIKYVCFSLTHSLTYFVFVCACVCQSLSVFIYLFNAKNCCFWFISMPWTYLEKKIKFKLTETIIMKAKRAKGGKRTLSHSEKFPNNNAKCDWSRDPQSHRQ